MVQFVFNLAADPVGHATTRHAIATINVASLNWLKKLRDNYSSFSPRVFGKAGSRRNGQASPRWEAQAATSLYSAASRKEVSLPSMPLHLLGLICELLTGPPRFQSLKQTSRCSVRPNASPFTTAFAHRGRVFQSRAAAG